ncbi:MAG: PucR family transcriptional regulator ligand-binding domain-containing protein [Clostridiales Family XIII bacterium]|nr:PucR family transcriptional regulator ligand-binding domain-containing protein [Clostridiales Family XIII bacterium]
MNLLELLNADGLNELTVINKNANLERVVSTVESSETPDIVDYLAPNAILITTAMAYRDNQEELCTLIDSLDRLPCAAVAIKLGRFIGELDEKVLALADARGFPLLQIPMYLTLGEVYHRILAFLWDNENENLVYTLNVQRQFYNLVHQGASVDKLTNTLGLILKSPIFVMGLFGEVCASCNATRRQENMARNLFLGQCRNGSAINRVTRVTGEETDAYLFVYPISVANYNTNYLVMLTVEEKLSNISEFALEQILLIFAIHFHKVLYNIYYEIQIRENCLRKLLQDETDGERFGGQVLAESRKFGVRESGTYQVLVAELRGLNERIFNKIRLMRQEEQYVLIYDLLKKQLENAGGDLIVFPDTDDWSYVIFVQDAVSGVDAILRRIHGELSSLANVCIEFAYGGVVRSVEGVKDSYRQAKEGFHRELSADEFPFIRQFRPSNILEYLKYLSKEHPDIGLLCRQTLKELADCGDATATELRKTLAVYLHFQGNVADTANALFLHRNTVRNRIRRCEEIMDGDLGDPPFRLQVQLSLLFIEA